MKPVSRILASPAVRLLAGLGLGALALWLALRDVDLAALTGVWGRLNKILVAITVLFAVLTNLGKAIRWRVLLSAGGDDPGMLKTLRLFFAGQLTNLAVPGRLGDFGRAYGVGGRSAHTTFALGTVLVEKALDTFMFALLTVALLVFAPLPDWLSRSAYSLVFVALLIFMVFWWMIARWEQVRTGIERIVGRLPAKFRPRVQTHAEAGLASLDAFRRRGALRPLVLMTLGIWTASLLVNFFGLRAFRLYLPAPASLLLLVVLQVGFSAALTPAAIGVFEFLCVVSLALYKVSTADGFGFGVFLHVVVLLPLLVGGGTALISLGLPGKGPVENLPGAD